MSGSDNYNFQIDTSKVNSFLNNNKTQSLLKHPNLNATTTNINSLTENTPNTNYFTIFLILFCILIICLMVSIVLVIIYKEREGFDSGEKNKNTNTNTIQ